MSCTCVDNSTALIGIRDDYLYHQSERQTEVCIATFDTEKGARNYAEDCRLKRPRLRDWQGPHIFKQKSLLGDFDDYEITELDKVKHTCLEHNPK